MITFDGTTKIIQLDATTTVSIRGIYSRWVDWAATSDNLKFLPAFEVVADPPTIPIYATLVNSWLIRPFAGSYTLTLNDGFLYSSTGGDPLAPVSSGVEPKVRYQNPVIAVGFSVGGSALTTEEHNRLFSVPTSTEIKTEIELSGSKLDKTLKKVKALA